MPTLLHVVGARPNFMKVAPVMRAGDCHPELRQVLVHTGQHYDAAMSDGIFTDLGLRAPDVNLGVGSATHAVQTGRIMIDFEPVVQEYRPDWVVVYGDVNSTIACALVAAKLGVRVAHVEAGLRSRDRSMPEELNRLLTDKLADLCLTPSRDGDANLLDEGIPSERICFVGNVMVDTLLALRTKARSLKVPDRYKLTSGQFAVVTFHRPSNVDRPEVLAEILGALDDLAGRMPVIFPMHPRTRQRMEEFGLGELVKRVTVLEPLGYLDTLGLLDAAALVVTDSGGLQEETTVLGVPCLTARPNTERPVTIAEGTNRLVASTRASIGDAVADVLRARADGRFQPGRPEGWDGRAGERVIAALLRYCGTEQALPAVSASP